MNLLKQQISAFTHAFFFRPNDSLEQQVERLELHLRLPASDAVAPDPDLSSGDNHPGLSRVNVNLLQAEEPLNPPYHTLAASSCIHVQPG